MSQTRPRIPLHRAAIVGNEIKYVEDAIAQRSLAGEGSYTRRCGEFLEKRFGARKAVMTHSGTSALDVCARAIGLGPGDEVLVPSFTFVATASAVMMCGARPVFVDVRPETMNIDERLIEDMITPRTKAIFPVHYAGCGCEMDTIREIARRRGLVVVEDAAQGVDADYKGQPLGTIGELGIYSFHEAKNIVGGQVGAVLVNDERFQSAVEIIRDKGTNRQQFRRREVALYTWVGLGSAYGPSELCTAYLLAQLEEMETIQRRRQEIFERYWDRLVPWRDRGAIELPRWPTYCRSNYHIFYMLLPTRGLRDALIDFLDQRSITAPFHYVPLHTSPVGESLGYREGMLPVTEDLAGRLIRLPLYHDLTCEEQDHVTMQVEAFLSETPASVCIKGSV